MTLTGTPSLPVLLQVVDVPLGLVELDGGVREAQSRLLQLLLLLLQRALCCCQSCLGCLEVRPVGWK